MLKKIKKLTWRRVKQELSSNPLDKRYYKSAELRKFGIAKVGENVKIEKSVKIVNPGYLEIGNDVIIDQFVTLVCGQKGLKVGSNVHIASMVHIAGGAGVVLEDYCGLASGVKVFSQTNDYVGPYLTGPTVPAKYTRVFSGPVVFQKHVVVGAGSVILANLTIGTGSTIGALSVVTHTLEPWGVYVGAPAVLKKERSKGVLEIEKQYLASKKR